MERTRRRFLATTGTALTTAVTGCLGGGGTESADSDDTGTPEPHPSTAGLDSQPRLGPARSQSDGLIVAFEDPSCPTCARFERDTMPKIRSELVEPGHATFVFRGYPIVYEWGKPATRVLEATYERDSDAHWALADHYFSNQGNFRSTDRKAVLAKSRTFLDSETDVDAEAVISAVEDGGAEPAVQTDIQAGENAGVNATPTVFLFRDGRFQTSGRALGFNVIKSTLGV